MTYLPSTVSGWPEPLAPTVSLSSRTWTQRFQTTAPPAPKPFSANDWPIPNGYQYTVGSRNWVQGSTITLAPVITYLPSVVAGWPDPLAPTSSIGSRTFIGSPIPAVEYVFRDPLIAPMRAALRPTDLNWTYRASALLAPPPPVALPPSNRDWPIPRGYAWPADSKTWVQRAQLVQPSAKPFSNTDWPNVRIATSPSESRTWTQRAQQVVPPPTPFNQFDWPNPKVAAYPSDLRNWVQRAQQVVPPPKPFALSEWAPPRGPVTPVDARNWVQRASLALLLTPVVVPPEPPVVPVVRNDAAGIKSGTWKPRGAQNTTSRRSGKWLLQEEEIKELTGPEIREAARELRADVRQDPLAEDVAKEAAALARMAEVLADIDRLEASVAELTRAIEFAAEQRAKAIAEAEDDDDAATLLLS